MKDVFRMTKAELIAELKVAAQRSGQRWLIGGPDSMSKDELVSAVCRLREAS